MGESESSKGKALQKAIANDKSPEWQTTLAAVTTAAENFGGIIEFVLNFSKKVAEALEPYSEQIKAAIEHFPKARLLEKAGWLPHETFPLHLLEAHGDNYDALNRAVAQYYRDKWPSVRETFEKTLLTRGIDDKARQLFRQALTAHEQELYALVSRAVFPEIERVARLKFSLPPRKRVASQKELKELVGTKLSLGDVSPGGIYGLTLFNKFYDHVYADVDDSTSTIMENDPVPNRHAALHGYFDYDNAQSSLNSLIMADYIFHLFDMIDSAPAPKVIENKSP